MMEAKVGLDYSPTFEMQTVAPVYPWVFEHSLWLQVDLPPRLVLVLPALVAVLVAAPTFHVRDSG